MNTTLSPIHLLFCTIWAPKTLCTSAGHRLSTKYDISPIFCSNKKRRYIHPHVHTHTCIHTNMPQWLYWFLFAIEPKMNAITTAWFLYLSNRWTRLCIYIENRHGSGFWAVSSRLHFCGGSWSHLGSFSGFAHCSYMAKIPLSRLLALRCFTSAIVEVKEDTVSVVSIRIHG